MIYEIKSTNLVAKIDTLGAELKSVTKSANEYMWSGDERYWDDIAPILFPICGRLLDSKYSFGGKTYEMDAHGFLKFSEFTPTLVAENRLTLTLSANETTRAIYPFDFEFVADFTVAGNTLELQLTVKNTGDGTLPYMVGWHPGFVLSSDGEINNFSLEFGGVDKLIWHPLQNGCFVNPNGKDYALVNGKYQFNEDEIYSNDTLVFCGTNERALLSSPNTSMAVEMKYSKNLPYFCIWKETDSNARFICLEPWSDVPSTGDEPEIFETRRMSRLPAKKSETYSYSVKFI
ncbi:MAG: hypothetical protein J6Q85_04345 [Clostridia bacterium]|nr:hypothetical protein [Clostridia bacterium]